LQRIQGKKDKVKQEDYEITDDEGRNLIRNNLFDEIDKKKYYSQTAEMEQKYLKYKNKYLSLKQELGV
jgi:hypothetical protein